MHKPMKTSQISQRLVEAVQSANDFEIVHVFDVLQTLPGRVAHTVLDRAHDVLTPDQRLFLAAALELYAERQSSARPEIRLGLDVGRTARAALSPQARGSALQ